MSHLFILTLKTVGHINTERWDYDASSGTSPRLISAELAAKMGITKEEKPSKELNGLWTVADQTREWLKTNEIRLNSLIEDSYCP